MMNFLNKIRKNTWIIFSLISISLLFFIIDPNLITKFFFNNNNYIGNINGNNISKKEYENCLEFLRKFNGKVSELSLKNYAFRLLINENLLSQQGYKLGITNTEKDIWKYIKTGSIYSKIDDFKDFNGKMNVKKFKLYIKNLDKLPYYLFPQIKSEKKIWNYEKNSIKNKIITKKYAEMLMYGLNVTNKEVELNLKNKNIFSIIDYIFIPYTEIEKKYNIHISKNDLYNYIKKHEFLYKKNNLRNISLIIFRSIPSLEDENNMKKIMNNLSYKLKNNYNHFDIIYKNSDTPFDKNFYTKDSIPPILKFFLKKNDKVGSVFGPIKDKNNYIIVKLTDKKSIFDSVLISNILISHKDAIYSLNKRNKKEALKIVKNIILKLKKHPNNFNFFLKKSDNFVNLGINNGKLGWIKYENQNIINNNFNIFSIKNKIGSIGITESNFGYNIIRIDDQKNIKNIYQFGFLIKTLKSSKKTINKINKNINLFLLKNKYSNINKIINNANKEKIETLFLEEIKENQWNIDGLNTELDKDIINWSFEKKRKKGDKKIFVDSKKNNFIVYLSGINNGKASIKEINQLITNLINKKIYKILHNKFSNKSLEEISNFLYKRINKSYKVNFHNSIINLIKEPKVLGAAFALKLNKTSNPILGKKGIFFIKPKKRFSKEKNSFDYLYEMEYLNNILRKNLLEKLNKVLLEKSKIKFY
ncbi:SurA N-terminal domain-containing protein [Blattabacterium cuenoti]|uniref:SurA N-terminal domain-containing protein n=1 Tax=Blattabacterium cuenoti TaxID=1653831 RepID=UPI001EECEEF2|nr:SurA N-terminal domain-containing protein [Blattabacterium cuenoti]